jgi:hypothetical protein
VPDRKTKMAPKTGAIEFSIYNFAIQSSRDETARRSLHIAAQNVAVANGGLGVDQQLLVDEGEQAAKKGGGLGEADGGIGHRVIP